MTRFSNRLKGAALSLVTATVSLDIASRRIPVE
jgi:hypothetical protein